ncbi:MAG: ECF-type sigma factor [Pseudomonadales bacterium]
MSDVTQILQNWSNESSEERGRVIAALYDELRRNAANHLRGERGVVELQPTSLVNEAYMRLIKIDRIDLQGRSHFMGLAGRIMREVLVDEARHLRAKKRDHGLQTRLTGDFLGNDTPLNDILYVDELLTDLEAIDPEFVRLFEARVFAGMTIEETASEMKMSSSTVKRKWKVVIAWLKERADSQSDDHTTPKS